MRLLFLGMPNVGKGTYATIMKEALGIPHISTGEMLREEVSKGSELGERINKIMLEGGLVPDEIIIELIKKRITQDDCKDGFILDGFPRNEDQAKQLQELTEIRKVLHFKADDEVIIERASGRLMCSDCQAGFHKTGKRPKEEGVCDECGGELMQREDDRPDRFQKRLDVYREKTAPLIDFYDRQGLLVEVVINKGIDEIRDKVVTSIKDYLEGKTDTIEEIR